jgi:predicted GNAT family acetyltransferase
MEYEDLSVNHNTTEHRFEMKIDGEYAFIDYKQSGDKVYLVHTEVAAPLEGRGVAAALVEKTFKYLEEHQLKMVPYCSYVQHYLRKHPEWNRLAAERE